MCYIVVVGCESCGLVEDEDDRKRKRLVGSARKRRVKAEKPKVDHVEIDMVCGLFT